ncbi:hypothetical protein OKA06_17670 [Novosphingobium sp. MW5]|nr:hypothetical protein [Novosphingobium sp. MW5]
MLARFCSRAIALAGALPLAAVSMPALAADCYGPVWRTVTDTAVGASYEMSAEPTTSYYIAYDTRLPGISTTEMARPGNAIPGRCSSFSVSVREVGGQIGNYQGLFDMLQAEATKGLRDGKLLSSRSLTVGGYPAREYSYSFVIDFFSTPARHRVLQVARGDKLMSFIWVWGDAGPPPEDSNRQFASIRLLPTPPNPHMASFALLQETLKKYWLYPAYNDKSPGFLSAELRAKFDPTRKADQKTLDAYGYPRSISFLRYENGAKIMRIKHDKATVDYTVRDNGKEITAISWRKVEPGAASTAAPATAQAAAPSAVPGATTVDLAPIKAARARFVSALVTTPAMNTRFTVLGGNDWCSVAYSVLPEGKTPEQVASGAFRIDWRKARSIEFVPGEATATPWWQNWVKVTSASGGYWPLHPGASQVGPMMAAGNEMMRLCKSVPPVN